MGIHDGSDVPISGQTSGATYLEKGGINKDLNDLEMAVESVIQTFGDLKGNLEWILQPSPTIKEDGERASRDFPEDERSPFSRRVQSEVSRLNSLNARIRDTQNQLDLG